MKRYLSPAIIALALVWTSVNAISLFSNWFSTSFENNPYLWQDEGYVVSPAVRVYEGGYKAFRCRGNDNPICYGSTQVFLDALLLKFLPDTIVKDNEFGKPPGTKWYFASEYPNVPRILRASRVVQAILLCLIFFGIARFASRLSVLESMMYGFGMTTFISLGKSFYGAKNDFSLGIFLVFFLIFAYRALRNSFKSFLIAVVIGIIAFGVKATILIPLVLLFPAYALVALFKGVKRLDILKHLSIATFLAIAVFIVLNPNVWISSTEAGAVLSLLAVAKAESIPWYQIYLELRHIAVFDIWPLLILFILVLRKRQRFSWVFLLYFISVPVLWTFLTVKASWHRPAYYLPGLVWCMGAILLFIKNEKNKITSSVLSFIAFLFIVQTSFLYGPPWKHLQQHKAYPRQDELTSVINEVLMNGERKLILDIALRPLVRKELEKAERVLFFDSLSEGWSIVKERAIKQWGEKAFKDDTKLLITCWAKTGPQFQTDVTYSPAADSWSNLLSQTCKSTNDLSSSYVYAFENGARPHAFVLTDISDGKLPVSSPSTPFNRINPRMYSGAINGIDYWFSPLVLYRNTELTSTLKWIKGLKGVTVSGTTSCKGTGNVLKISFLKEGRQIASATTTFDSGFQTCSDFPLVCKLGIENWFQKRYPFKPITLPTNVHPFETATVELSAQFDKQTKDRCRLAVDMISLDR